MTRRNRIALHIAVVLTLAAAAGQYAHLHYLRTHCQSTYGSNPWTGGAHGNTPRICRTPAEDRRITEVERGPHEEYGK